MEPAAAAAAAAVGAVETVNVQLRQSSHPTSAGTQTQREK